MCLAMCLKKLEFQADCVYKHDVYKKNECNSDLHTPYQYLYFLLFIFYSGIFSRNGFLSLVRLQQYFLA